MVLKPEHRIIPVLGQIIDISGVADNAALLPLAGQGLSQSDSDRLIEHNTKDEVMWLGKKEDLAKGLIFDLGQVSEIETIEIWNYNKPGYTSRGISKADVDVLTEDGTWKTVLKDASILEGEGSDDYDEPTVLSFQPIKAQKIRLANLVSFKDEGLIGLSEIRIHKPLGFEACNPEPLHNATLKSSGQTRLSWTPGKDAVVYDVYAGSTPQSLVLLGRTAQTEANLSGLAAGKTYAWRLDAVRVDGSVTQGEIWSFAIEEGRAWRNWDLDEFNERKNLDGSSKRSIELMDDAVWLATDGQRKGIVQLDGKNNYMRASALKTKMNAMTLCMWLWADGMQNHFTGLAFCRGGNTVSGLNLCNNNELGYHWNNDNKTWGFDSGMFVPQNKWVFAAVAVEPTQATLYLYEDGKLKSSTNKLRHEEEEFNTQLTFGFDPESSENRRFKGKLDDIKIFNYCLTSRQIQAVAENKPVEPEHIESVLALADTKLVDPKTDLNTIAKQLKAEQQAAEATGKRSFWPGVAIIGVILAIVAFTQIGKRQ